MLTKGEDVKLRQKVGDHLELRSEKVRAATKVALQDYTAFERSAENPTIPERQKGNPLTTIKFVNKVKKILPYVHWVLNPHHSDKFGLFLKGKQFTSGEYPSMPEWSILEITYEEMPTISPETFTTKEGFKRELFHPGIPPMQRTPAGFREVKRGWRTILLRLIKARLLSLETVEQEFGIGNRASWAATLKFYSPQSGDLVL